MAQPHVVLKGAFAAFFVCFFVFSSFFPFFLFFHVHIRVLFPNNKCNFSEGTNVLRYVRSNSNLH